MTGHHQVIALEVNQGDVTQILKEGRVGGGKAGRAWVPRVLRKLSQSSRTFSAFSCGDMMARLELRKPRRWLLLFFPCYQGMKCNPQPVWPVGNLGPDLSSPGSIEKRPELYLKGAGFKVEVCGSNIIKTLFAYKENTFLCIAFCNKPNTAKLSSSFYIALDEVIDLHFGTKFIYFCFGFGKHL